MVTKDMEGEVSKVRQRRQSPVENRNETNQPPDGSIQADKDKVFEIVREIVHSGNLISAETFQPLTDREKVEHVCRSFFYFSKEDKEWQEKVESSSTILPPVYENILRLKRLGEPFSEVLKRTVQTICQIPERDQQAFAKWVEEQREMGMPYGEDPQPKGIHETSLNEHNLIERTIGQIKENWLGGTLGTISSNSFVRSLLSGAIDEAVEALKGTVQSYNISDHVRSGFIFSGVYLSCVVVYNLFKTTTGRSWARAGKNILDELGSLGVGQLVGVIVAAALAPLTGGWSLFFGGVSGIAANMFTRYHIKKWTCKLLGLPEDEMLEKAYKVLEVDQLEPNDMVAKNYREKSRKHHPDKYLQRKPNATEEEKTRNLRTFLKIQAALAMIVAGREDDQEDYDKARKNFQRIEREESLAKKRIDIRIRVAVAGFFNKLIPFWQTAECECFPAITDGIMPYQYFEEGTEATTQSMGQCTDDEELD